MTYASPTLEDGKSVGGGVLLLRDNQVSIKYLSWINRISFLKNEGNKSEILINTRILAKGTS